MIKCCRNPGFLLLSGWSKENPAQTGSNFNFKNLGLTKHGKYKWNIFDKFLGAEFV